MEKMIFVALSCLMMVFALTGLFSPETVSLSVSPELRTGVVITFSISLMVFAVGGLVHVARKRN